MATTVHTTTACGSEAYELRSDAASVTILPAHGAKVISLRDLGTGREWMWRAEVSPEFRRLPTGHPFADGPLVGADECLPTVAACRWCRRDLTDHGEVWTEPWQLDRGALADGRIATRLRLPISPLAVERSVSLQERTIEFAYVLQNIDDEPSEYIWAFHPMMTIEPGDHVQLPPEVTNVRTELCMGDTPLGERGDRWTWPVPLPGLNFADLALGGDGRAVKLFTEPLRQGFAAIVNERTGDRLAFEFDTNEIDTLGIWINRGGFGGYQHVAIEPTNGAPDALDVAVEQWRRFGLLAPGETRRWSFRIHVGR